jgi:molybdenum cofactor biosynthesis enzyme MoaA
MLTPETNSSASPDVFPILAPGAGFPVVSQEQLLALSVEDAWLLCGGNEPIFSEWTYRIGLGIAEYKGLALEDTEATKSLLLTHTAGLFRSDPSEPLTSMISHAVARMAEHDPLPAAMVAEYNQARTCADKRSLCHAPGSSMFFGRNGFVMACCYSRANPVGRWPEQTVAEIWNGAKIKAMRDQMSRNILPMGCETCADQLRAKNYRGFLAANFDWLIPAPKDGALDKLAALFGRKPAEVYPIRMEFELSNKCNLECDMCSGVFSSSIRANREHRPALAQVYDSTFVEQLKPFIPHLKQAKFLGGEPFLVDMYYEIWELFTELNPECELIITTNGTVFTPKVQRMIEKLNFNVVMSLDSVTKVTYESIRINATLEKTLANLDQFAAILQGRGKPMTLAICPMVLNWREIPGMVEFANGRRMGVYFNTVIFPEAASLKFLRAEELAEIGAHLRAGVLESTDAREMRNYNALADLAQQVDAWRRDAAAREAAEALATA